MVKNTAHSRWDNINISHVFRNEGMFSKEPLDLDEEHV